MNKELSDSALEGIAGGVDIIPVGFRYTCGDCGFTAVAEAIEYNVELLKYMVGGCCPVCRSANLTFEKLKSKW
jgi:hypothetical protein